MDWHCKIWTVRRLDPVIKKGQLKRCSFWKKEVKDKNWHEKWFTMLYEMTICTFALQVFTPMKKKAWAFENSANFFYFQNLVLREKKKNSKGTKKRGKKNEDCKRARRNRQLDWSTDTIDLTYFGELQTDWHGKVSSRVSAFWKGNSLDTFLCLHHSLRSLVL